MTKAAEAAAAQRNAESGSAASGKTLKDAGNATNSKNAKNSTSTICCTGTLIERTSEPSRKKERKQYSKEIGSGQLDLTYDMQEIFEQTPWQLQSQLHICPAKSDVYQSFTNFYNGKRRNKNKREYEHSNHESHERGKNMNIKQNSGVAALLLIVVLIPSIMAISNVSAASAPTQLKLYVGPTNVPADNNIYNCIAVQLQDSKGNPARASQDTIISLSSSLTNIADVVNPTVTIPKGSTYTTAQLQTTFSPGTTSLTATASGYTTVQVPITTVGPVPSALAVIGYPSTLPADAKSYDDTVIVQLQDKSGSPAKAPNEGITVVLASSDTSIGTVDETVTIEGGETYTLATLTTTMKPGTTSITAVATGYTSIQGTIKTQTPAANPNQLKIYLGPSKVQADQETYPSVAVQLQNTQGAVAQTTEDVTVTLSSSDPAIGTVDELLTIPSGESYAVAYFKSTYKPGTTTITATASNYKTTQANVQTLGATPSRLAVYAVPSTLPADYQAYNIIQVQLQDSSGKPAMDPNGDITINLFSSNPDGGNVQTSQLTIPFGQTSAQGTFISTYSANKTTITAQASDYATGQTQITTQLIDQITLNVALKPEASVVYPGKNTTITAYVTFEGKLPAPAVTIKFNSTNGGNFTQPKYEGNGTYTTLFIAPKSNRLTICNVTANATRTGYVSGEGKYAITVSTQANPNLANLGSMQMLVSQGDGTPVSSAIIIATTLPNGAQPVFGSTNDTGYAVFSDITAGQYIFQITKEGYDPQNQTVTVLEGQTAAASITLVQQGSPLIIIVVIAVIVAVVAIVAGYILLIRRKKQKRFKGQSQGLSNDYNADFSST